MSGAKIAHMDGSCGDSTGGVYTCDAEALNSYVDGVDLEATGLTVGVTFDGTDWTIDYSRFGEIEKDSKFRPGETGTEFTENEIKAKLDPAN